MLKVDIHTHILPENLPDLEKRYGYGEFVRLEHNRPNCARMMKGGKFFREVESNLWDPTSRAEECTATAVDVQVLSTVPVMFSYWAKAADALDLSKLLNDHISGVVNDFPKRFVGLGTVPLQSTDLAINEMERCIRELDFAGIQIGTHVNGRNLDDESFHPFFEAAEGLDASLFVHPWDMLSPERMDKYWLQWLVGMPAETAIAICCMVLGGVFEKYPDLKVAFAHGGGAFPGAIGRIEAGFHARPDLVAVETEINPRDFLGKFYVDSLIHDREMLRYLIQLVGANRIALGSDYPFPLGELRPGELVESMDELPMNDKEWILGRTALEWLGLPEEQFLPL